MLFLNLDKLKIHKSYRHQTFTVEINEPGLVTGAIGHMKVAAENALHESFDVLPAIDALYEITICGDGEANDEEIDGFLSATTIITRAFFSRILIKEGRARERRLDVPENLKVMNANMSIIKEAVNSKTLIDNFNLHIVYKDLHYWLIDTKELENSEFVHDVDELEGE